MRYNDDMVNYAPLLQNLTPELQLTLLQLVGAVEQNLREQLTPPREEIVDVSALVNGLLETQQSTMQRMARLEIVLLQLAEAQQRTEMRVEQLAEAQQGTQQAVNRMASSVDELAKTVRAMQPRLARADGWQLEQRYVERAPSYFGRWLRQISVLWPGRLERTLEQQLDATLSPEERDEVLRLDAILRGKTPPSAQDSSAQDEIYVALEASVTINQNDVERAGVRAALLRRLGVRVVAVVAGEAIEQAAEADAQANAVAILRNGTRHGWEAALAAA
ncbi:MAG: hypothetical protein M3Q45_12095 [Chloroflexota bacterium]|nr:hypothetical protein [Chloroflexota bacterium]